MPVSSEAPTGAHIHTRVEFSAHPDGPIALWVKDRSVNLSVTEAKALSRALADAAQEWVESQTPAVLSVASVEDDGAPLP